jgi:hypothetical protein
MMVVRQRASPPKIIGFVSVNYKIEVYTKRDNIILVPTGQVELRLQMTNTSKLITFHRRKLHPTAFSTAFI